MNMAFNSNKPGGDYNLVGSPDGMNPENAGIGHIDIGPGILGGGGENDNTVTPSPGQLPGTFDPKGGCPACGMG
jgi:hypothetical protein